MSSTSSTSRKRKGKAGAANGGNKRRKASAYAAVPPVEVQHTQLFIDNKFVDSESGKTFAVEVRLVGWACDWGEKCAGSRWSLNNAFRLLFLLLSLGIQGPFHGRRDLCSGRGLCC